MATIQLHVIDGVPGHAFISLESDEGVTTVVGYYPEGATLSERAGQALLGSGSIRDDSPKLLGPPSNLTTKGPYEISQAQYDAVYARIQEVTANPGLYSLTSGPGTRNCTVFALELLRLAGQIAPEVTVPRELVDPEFLILKTTEFRIGWFGRSVKNLADYRSAMALMGQAQAVLPPAPRYDPLVIDLDRNGLVTTTVATGAYFDMANDGFAEKTGWVGIGDALLVRDLNANGTIDSGRELFGDQTMLANGSRATSGYAALADLDSNADGKITSADTAWDSLRAWADDGDGVTEAGELIGLTESGISELALSFSTVNQTTSSNNVLAQTNTAGAIFSNGVTAQTGSFVLRSDLQDTLELNLLAIPAGAEGLPELAGSGSLHNLSQAMARSESLTALVASMATSKDSRVLYSGFDDLLYQWTGASTAQAGSMAVLSNEHSGSVSVTKHSQTDAVLVSLTGTLGAITLTGQGSTGDPTQLASLTFDYQGTSDQVSLSRSESGSALLNTTDRVQVLTTLGSGQVQTISVKLTDIAQMYLQQRALTGNSTQSMADMVALIELNNASAVQRATDQAYGGFLAGEFARNNNLTGLDASAVTPFLGLGTWDQVGLTSVVKPASDIDPNAFKLL